MLNHVGWWAIGTSIFEFKYLCHILSVVGKIRSGKVVSVMKSLVNARKFVSA